MWTMDYVNLGIINRLFALGTDAGTAKGILFTYYITFPIRMFIAMMQSVILVTTDQMIELSGFVSENVS